MGEGVALTGALICPDDCIWLGGEYPEGNGLGGVYITPVCCEKDGRYDDFRIVNGRRLRTVVCRMSGWYEPPKDEMVVETFTLEQMFDPQGYKRRLERERRWKVMSKGQRKKRRG